MRVFIYIMQGQLHIKQFETLIESSGCSNQLADNLVGSQPHHGPPQLVPEQYLGGGLQQGHPLQSPAAREELRLPGRA